MYDRPLPITADDCRNLPVPLYVGYLKVYGTQLKKERIYSTFKKFLSGHVLRKISKVPIFQAFPDLFGLPCVKILCYLTACISFTSNELSNKDLFIVHK